MHQSNSDLDEEQLAAMKEDEIASDESDSATAIVLREVARLQADNRNLKSKNLRVWGVVVALSVLFSGVILIGISVYPKHRFIATKDNQALCGLTPETAPRLSASTLTDYAREAVINSYTYDYINYRERINDAVNKFYTQSGHKAFMKSMDESGNLEKVIKGRFILRTMVTHTPQLEEQGIKNLVPYYLVVVPIAIEFYSGGDTIPKSRQDFYANVTIVQTPINALNWRGIGVDSVVLSPYVPRK